MLFRELIAGLLMEIQISLNTEHIGLKINLCIDIIINSLLLSELVPHDITGRSGRFYLKILYDYNFFGFTCSAGCAKRRRRYMTVL